MPWLAIRQARPVRGARHGVFDRALGAVRGVLGAGISRPPVSRDHVVDGGDRTAQASDGGGRRRVGVDDGAHAAALPIDDRGAGATRWTGRAGRAGRSAERDLDGVGGAKLVAGTPVGVIRKPRAVRRSTLPEVPGARPSSVIRRAVATSALAVPEVRWVASRDLAGGDSHATGVLAGLRRSGGGRCEGSGLRDESGPHGRLRRVGARPARRGRGTARRGRRARRRRCRAR